MYATVRFSFLHLGTTEVMLIRWPSSEVNASESLVSKSLVSASLVSEQYGPYAAVDPAQPDQTLFPRLGTGSSGRKRLRRHTFVLQLWCLMWNVGWTPGVH